MHFKKKSANVKINFLFPEPFSVEINSPVRVWGRGACFKKDLNSSSLPGLKKKQMCTLGAVKPCSSVLIGKHYVFASRGCSSPDH